MNKSTKKAIDFLNHVITNSEPIKVTDINKNFPLILKKDYIDVDILISDVRDIEGNMIPFFSTISLIVYLVEKITGERIAFTQENGSIVGVQLFTGKTSNKINIKNKIHE